MGGAACVFRMEVVRKTYLLSDVGRKNFNEIVGNSDLDCFTAMV